MLFKAWTGSCAVREVADKLRAAGFEATEGTEHVYVHVAICNRDTYNGADLHRACSWLVWTRA